jgi:oligoendopeptidase F
MRTAKFVLVLTFLLIIPFSQLPAQQSWENREDIPSEYKWDLTDIYNSWEEWENDLKLLEEKMDAVSAMKGKIKEGPENLLEVRLMEDDLWQLAYKVYRYPQLNRDSDTRDQMASANMQKVQILFAKFGTATSWINPEILEIPWETMEKWLASDPAFEPYRFGISDLYRQQAHVLSEDKEKLLSFYSRFNGTPSDIYGSITTADIEFPEVVLSGDDTVRASNANYSRVLATNFNQEDRKKIFEAHYGVFESQHNTYASIYNAVCQSDWAGAQARNYSSSLEAALDNNNVPVSVYENLVSTVKANTEPLQRYMRLRKKILGLEKYHSYDGSIPIIDFNKTYPYAEAKQQVLASVAPLGDAYQQKVETALSGGWIDVFESKGKRSGAYSTNVYGVHPYMLLNYNETLDYVFTLGHELGHTLHTLLANENQPFATASYTIFVAEVASTFNEALLLDHMLAQTDDPKERIALLQQSISNIVGTFFFQTLLADYELQAHRLAEEGKPITSDVLTGIMKDLFSAYYGDTIEEDEVLYYVWARIPHVFRSPFYVYQYATCFASSAQIYNNVMQAPADKRPAEIERYLGMLKAGGSAYPMELLKRAGVDLTKPEPVLAVIGQLDTLVGQLETEVAKLD